MRRPRFLFLLIVLVVSTATRPAFAGGLAKPAAGGLASSNPIAPAPDRANDRGNDLECLTTAIAYEAGHEPIDGRRAVADVILNRTRSAGHPASVCGVVYEGSERRTGCQFTFTCDGSLRRVLSVRVMDEARQIAREALSGVNPPAIGGAINYHADYVSPYWASSMVRVARIGRHIFYRSARGFAGSPFQPTGPARTNSAAPVSANPAPRVFAPWGISLGPLR